MFKRAAPRLLCRRTVATACAAAAAVLLGVGSPAPRAALQGKIDAKRRAAQALRSGLATDTHHLRAATRRLRATERRLSGLQSELNAREAQLAQVKSALVADRKRLTELENRLLRAVRALTANLRQTYEGDRPDALTVVLEARGFADLLERLQFLDRIRSQDVQVVREVRATKAAVTAEANRLGVLEARDQRLTAEVLARRNEVARVRTTLVRERIAALHRRAHKAARLHALHGQLAKLVAREVRLSRVSGSGSVNVGMVRPTGNMPAVVARVIAAANAIAGLPYRWGGGHGSFHDSAYDCSGSVSYALAAGGLLSSPLDSTGFESWGAPGPGRWITVYANSGHAFMIIAGRRFDTSGLGSGSRWASGSRSTAGFVARHPPGL
jgi:hypothetical protein